MDILEHRPLATEPARPLTLEVTVAPACAYPWPHAAPTEAPAWHERAAKLLFKLFTPTVEAVTLPNFGWLSPGLYRGAQPGRLGFAALKGMDVDTVINLRAESNEEAAIVRGLGMKAIYFPLDPLAAPTHAQTLAFLHAATDPSHGRVYFHCYHGADRTGVFAACFRMAHDGWSLREALAELRAHGFHQAFQQAMLLYVREFELYWRGLPPAERARVLHQA